MIDDILESNYVVPIGKADIKKTGNNVTLVTYSYMLSIAMEAAKIVEQEGISVEVIDLRSLRPLDIDTVVASVYKTKKAICLQEAWLACSIASELSATISERCFGILEKPVKRIGALDCPIPFAKELEFYVLPSVEKVTEEIRKLVNLRGQNEILL